MQRRFNLKMGKYDYDWCFSRRHFGEDRWLTDFMFENYTYFVDNVLSVPELISGLSELDPFVDDAMEVAKTMSETEFADFKLALAHERQIWVSTRGESHLSRRHNILIFPRLFVFAAVPCEQFRVCLGACLMRMVELGVPREAFEQEKLIA